MRAMRSSRDSGVPGRARFRQGRRGEGRAAGVAPPPGGRRGNLARDRGARRGGRTRRLPLPAAAPSQQVPERHPRRRPRLAHLQVRADVLVDQPLVQVRPRVRALHVTLRREGGGEVGGRRVGRERGRTREREEGRNARSRRGEDARGEERCVFLLPPSAATDRATIARADPGAGRGRRAPSGRRSSRGRHPPRTTSRHAIDSRSAPDRMAPGGRRAPKISTFTLTVSQ